jgi:hypothetical protein
MTVSRAGLSPTTNTRFGTAILIVVVLLSVIPATLVRIPPILDYPNHYVRLWLIDGGVLQSPVSKMYALDWSYASTNLAIDLVARVLKGIAPVGTIGPLVMMLAITLRPLGILLLGQGLFGTARWWHVLCFVLAWNWALVAGFFNFEISLGLAMLGAALDVRLARHGRVVTALLRIVVGGIVLIAHPFGFIFYVALLSGLAIGFSFAPLRSARGLWEAAIRVVLVCLPTVVPLAMLLLLAPVLPTSHVQDPGGFIGWQTPSLSSHISVLLTGIKTYRFSVDAVFGLFLAVPIVVALIRHRLRTHAGLLIVTIVLTIVSLLMPSRIMGIAGVETRLPCMVALALSVAVLPDFRFSARTAALATGLAVLVVAARSAWIGHIWVDRQPDLASVSRALEHVPAGAAILPLENLPGTAQMAQAPTGRFLGNNPIFWHYPTLAIMDRHAFVPTLFTAAGQQPVRVLPPWKNISVVAGPLAPVDKLGDPTQGVATYLSRWRDCFDYILVVNADMPNADGPLLASPAIVPVDNEGFARLYRIVRVAGGQACH